MRTAQLIYTGAALTSLMCGVLIANSIWPLPRPGADAPAAAPTAWTGPPTAGPQEQVRPRIDVVFVLDTTGSMSGLIDGAKQTIWSIADRLASGQPRPDIRVGLVAFRDLGDAYVTRVTPLSRDLDGVHAELRALSADGGGDHPENVNQALFDAIHQMPWDRGDRTLRLIFLVGDAPPHDDYAQLPSSAALAAQARAAGITINTLRCGGDSATEAAWQTIAQAAGGRYASIAQDGGVAVVASPFDDKLAELNRALAATTIGYGSAERQAAAKRKASDRASMSGASAAAAASWSAKSGRMNDEDLITALEEGTASLDTIPEAALPTAMQGLSRAAQQAHVEELRGRRRALNREILELSKRRDAYVEANAAPSGFDGQVVDILRDQAAAIDVAY